MECYETNDTNCVIQNDCGESKNVHLNQLKVIAPRHLRCEQLPPFEPNNEKSYVDFGDFVTGDDNVENVLEEEANELINEAWCNVDERNILPNRTRSL